MLSKCPHCNRKTLASETKEVTGGQAKWEKCRSCPYRALVTTFPQHGHGWNNIDMGLDIQTQAQWEKKQ